MKKKNILVTGVGGRSVGSGILHSLLRCGEAVASRWNVIATDASSFAWGLYKADHSALLPPASANDYLKSINQLVHQYSIDAIIPGTQPELDVLSKNPNHIEKAVLISNRQELMILMLDKSKLQHALRDLGCQFIETKPFHEYGSLVQKYGFPIVVKPLYDSGGSKGLFLAKNEKELESLKVQGDSCDLLCVQPYVGDADNEYTVGVISDKDGIVIDSIVMKRKLEGMSLLSSREISGKTYKISTGYSQGFIIKHPMIQEFCENLASKLKSVGPLNMQLRLHEDKPYIFELHPRFSGTTPIRAEVGFNEVDVLLRNFLTGEKFGRINYKHNVAAIRAFEHVIVPIERMKS